MIARVTTEPRPGPLEADPARVSRLAARARASPYYPALSHPVLRRWLRARRSERLVFVNAVLRAVALGLIGGLALAGRLDPAGYVALLGVSSLLSAWGVAGKYTLVADLLPAEHRIAGNSMFGLADQLSLMIGPTAAAG